MITLNFTPFPELSSERLDLKRIEEKHVEDLFALHSNDQVMRFMDKPKHKTVDDTLKLLSRIDQGIGKNENITWGLFLKGAPQLIGFICYPRIKKQHHRGEVGYVLHPDFQRQGLMQEALTVVIDHGFKVFKFHSIMADINPNNLQSARLLVRNGFVREAYFKESYFFDGKYMDTAIYSLINPND